MQLLGLLIAVLGLCGYWLTRDVQRTVLSPEEARLLNPEGAAFQASFVVAGRDYDYDPAGPLVWQDGEWVRSFTTEPRLGYRTDTILYVNFVGNRIYMVSVPRDIFLPRFQIPINEVYAYPETYGSASRADNLRRAVSELLGVPIDYYAVINIDIFERLVDAIGGVELEVPRAMVYRDQAAGLEIDLQPGFQRLSGAEAAGFVRYRELLRGDIDRIDNVKTLAYAVLGRLQELNVRAALKLPELIDTYFDEVDTNASPALFSQLLPRLGEMTLEAATLPTSDMEGSGRFLETDPEAVEAFLATLFGGTARTVTRTPEGRVLLTDRSGVPGAGDRVRELLLAAGVAPEQLRVRRGAPDAITRVIVTRESLAAAPFYADLLGVGWQQIDRFAVDADIEVILGQDAARFDLFRRAQAPTPQMSTPPSSPHVSTGG
ncbi:cell envelope-related transcriptional attenuator [Truepera radiovictrix DSM 17093]|uniref:Cell envelope-related transcriptional attenuator n=1 Tax=Truepera radiovictrix (strain DSM 17093 / CIP 108686 / LMG 22925 / RQ-24) TaxID=649638 RepID=D7CWS9_TRURR|nr:cell envelope-related transcriptional attenuator [Truepera radiovictrix DSM 17093]